MHDLDLVTLSMKFTVGTMTQGRLEDATMAADANGHMVNSYVTPQRHPVPPRNAAVEGPLGRPPAGNNLATVP